MKKLAQVIPVLPGYRRPSGVITVPAPTVVSLTPDEGSEAGGTSVTITGTGFVSGATVQFGLVPATGVTWVNATTITCTTPARPAAIKSVRVTNPDGRYGELANAYEFTVGSVLDPATLTLNGWLQNFASSPWAGTASAGGSGSRSVEAGSAPSAGTLNSKGTADFVAASSNYLFDATNLADAYLDPTGYRVVLLVNLTTAPSAAGAIYDNPGLLTEGGGNWGIVYNADGVHCYHHDGGYQVASSASAVATGGWHLIDVQYDGTDLTLSVDGVAGTPAPAGSLGSVAAVLRLGANYAPAVYANARVADVMIAGDALLGTSAADFVGYANDEYALSL